MNRTYKASSSLLSGEDTQYRSLIKLAEKHHVVSIKDEIDCDSLRFPVGQYEKYYLCFEFNSELDRNLFVIGAKDIVSPK